MLNKKQYLSGERVSAAQAEAMGLINRAVPSEELDQVVSSFARKLAEADLQHGSLQRRPRGKKRKEEEEAKKKRRRVNPKFAKLTNTHLAGTPIGDLLQAALEGRDIEGSATGGARFDVA